MTGPDDRTGPDFDRFDETLDDELEVEGLPPGAVGVEVARQRLAHGLLRSAAEATDVAARGQRLGSILAAIEAADRETQRVSEEAARRDETFGDEVEVGEVPTGPVKVELARQRLAHGLLVAAYREGAASRGQRVSDIVTAASGGGRILRFPGRWSRIAVAAVVVLAVSIGLRFLLGGRTESVLDAAIRSLDESVDRKFELEVKWIDDNPIHSMGRHVMWFRPLQDGRFCFRMELDGERSGRHQVGCDGLVVWRWNRDVERDREALPVADANTLFRNLQATEPHPEVADLDHFDLRKLLEHLAHESNLRGEGAVYKDEDGHSFHTYFADRFESPDFGRLWSLLIRVDREENVIDVLEFVREDPLGPGLFRYRFEYRGLDPQEISFYRQPW